MALADRTKLWEAIRSALTGNSDVSALVSTRVYSSHRPAVEGDGYPRIVCEQVSETLEGSDIARQRWSLHCFSVGNDGITAERIGYAARAALDKTQPSASGFKTFWCAFEMGRHIGIVDGVAHYTADFILHFV